ncbi:MAG: flavin reductase family protein [Anaerolineae bacterium]|nr:flavin reductase family protein [Anaerolineae bacterium]
MKTHLGAKNCLFPIPTTLVGALVNGKPNYLTVAYVGIVDNDVISVSLGKKQYTAVGIKEHGVFSVNIPPAGLVAETDYCGMVSGKKADKSTVFTNFYGALEAAPMIEECAINMACRVIQTLELDEHFAFIGKVVETYCDDACVVDGRVDFACVQPFFYAPDKDYFALGERFAQAWHAGKAVKERRGGE